MGVRKYSAAPAGPKKQSANWLGCARLRRPGMLVLPTAIHVENHVFYH